MKKKFSRIFAAQPHHLDGKIITVEIDVSVGLHRFDIVGLPDKAVDEARSRVGSALKNSGFPSPKQSNHKTTVSLAPAEIRKNGSYYDLAIALGYLLAIHEIDFNTQNKVFLGELSLDGELRPIRGALPLTYAAQKAGYAEIYLPHQNASEAAYISDIAVYGVHNIEEVIKHLRGEHTYKPATCPPRKTHTLQSLTDFADIRGQEVAKRGLEIAAAGGHNVAMFGPPGTGKTMLAKAFTGILPSLSHYETLEVTSIHSIAGILDENLVTKTPFRSPHHTASYVSIIGGGSHPKPGEITLAHRGVLFLDEFPEFDSQVIESLRQPLEDRVVHISRAQGSATFPANFILIAALNPCPCGFYGSPVRNCTCSPGHIRRYQARLSGPIVDRIDIWLPVEHIAYEKLDKNTNNESSENIKNRVIAARSRQLQRFHAIGQLNSHLTSRDLNKLAITQDARDILVKSARKLGLSPRSYHRMIKLAQTIADIEKHPEIMKNHILEALQYRPKLSY